MANTNFFVAKNGIAVGNTTSTKHVINNAGQWIGDPTGVIQNSYDQANVATSIAQSSYNSGNDTIVFAQSAYDFANTLALSGGSVISVTNDETTNQNLYINFVDDSSGVTPTVKTSANNLTFNPLSGTLMVKQLDITPFTNIYSGEITTDSTSATTFDSFDVTLYRSAFYQVQLEFGGSFHALNINIINTGSSALIQTYGDVYNDSPLATFSANIVGGLLVVQVTSVSSGTVISYLRNAIVKKTLGVPTGDLGWLTDSITSYFDAGFDLDSVTSSFDYGTV